MRALGLHPSVLAEEAETEGASQAAHLQARLREKLAELAPVGTPVTPELLATVRAQLAPFVASVLVEQGLLPVVAKSVAAAIVAATQIREKAATPEDEA